MMGGWQNEYCACFAQVTSKKITFIKGGDLNCTTEKKE